MTTDLHAASARPARIPRSDRHSRIAAIALVVAFATACSPSAAPSASPTVPGGSGSPTAAAPTASPDGAGINHPTGPGDVVLRMETDGGMMVEANAVATPTFTLYGDGTVVFRDPTAAPPEAVGGVRLQVPFSTVRLGEEGIQALLREALGPGGLAIATGPYMGMGADIPTTTFTIAADGDTKQVMISGFLPDLHPQDAQIVAALGHLAETLDGFSADIAGEDAYIPTAYRGVLIGLDQPVGPVVEWPWADFTPADFDGGEQDLFKTRTLSAADVAQLGVDGAVGGLSGLVLESGDKLYSFALRPLLPDEVE